MMWEPQKRARGTDLGCAALADVAHAHLICFGDDCHSRRCTAHLPNLAGVRAHACPLRGTSCSLSLGVVVPQLRNLDCPAVGTKLPACSPRHKHSMLISTPPRSLSQAAQDDTLTLGYWKLEYICSSKSSRMGQNCLSRQCSVPIPALRTVASSSVPPPWSVCTPCLGPPSRAI